MKALHIRVDRMRADRKFKSDLLFAVAAEQAIEDLAFAPAEVNAGQRIGPAVSVPVTVHDTVFRSIQIAIHRAVRAGPV